MRLARRRLATLALVGLVAAAIAGGFAACKQGEGEYCQSNGDCQTGLICNKSTSTCLQTATSNNDAAIDAAVDASTDALDVDAPDAN